jgi:hypothetical protein
MASAVRKLTGVGGDIRKIARLLQKEAPPGHMLAYINQEEADLLKARGGSGKPHADTGVPSFEEEEYVPDYSPTGGGDQPSVYQRYDNPQTSTYGSGETTAFPDAAPIQTSAGDLVAPGSPFSGQFRAVNAQGISDASSAPFVTANTAVAPVSTSAAPSTAAADIEAERQILTGKIKPQQPITPGAGGAEKSWWEDLKPETKARLGIGGAQAVLGAYQISQSADQAKKYREDMAKLAQPYQAEGKKLIAQAQSGELTPAAQQQLQAAQAQAAQGAQARGGVGAQQAMMAVENMRQQLLQNQYDYGLKVSGIGDQIASGAIKAGMQADQYVNSLAGSYANNIARTLSNAPTYVASYAQQNQ